MTTDCDFLVIGAGVSGAAAARELAALGSTILLEMEDQPLEQDEEHEGERRLHQRENERQAVRGLSEICSLLV